MEDSGKIVLGVLAGVAIGATLGILFAPDKGSETRRKIATKSNDYSDELQEKFNEFIEGLTKQFETMKEEAVRMEGSLATNAGEAFTEASSSVK